MVLSTQPKRSGKRHYLYLSVFLFCFLTCLGAVLSAPFGFLFQGELQTGLILSTVWYWSLYKPNPFQLISVFSGGLVIELFRDGPPGILLFWMLVTYGVANAWRFSLARGGFFLSLFAFALTMLGEGIIEWSLISLRDLTILSPVPLFFQFALTLAAYLILYGFFLWGRRNFDVSDNI